MDIGNILFFVICFSAAIVFLIISISMIREGHDKILICVVSLICIPSSMVLIYVPFYFYNIDKSPNLVTLKKEDWHCTKYHNVTTMVLSGKVFVPITTQVCDQYGKKEE